jgi:hypothetical protein
MKNKTLKFINPLIGLLVINQMLTAFFRDSLSFHQFGTVHGLGGYLLFSLVIVHFVLNWSWIKANYFKRSKVVSIKTNSAV